MTRSPSAPEELIGVLKNVRTFDDFSVCQVQHEIDGEKCTSTAVGNASVDAQWVTGVEYRFLGKWTEHRQYGRQFKFDQFLRGEPHSRVGVVNYLAKFARNIGPSLASRLYDQYGSEAIKILRTDPAMASCEIKGLTLQRAHEAAATLQEHVALEDTRVELTNLFAGRGFPGALVDQVIEAYGILAPKRIARDPFCMLVAGFSGCGFARCDRLYCDLGLPLDRLKRQMICIWHVLREDSNGNTWTKRDDALRRFGELIGGTVPRPKRALQLGYRSGWIAKFVDDSKTVWLAEAEKAAQEAYLAERLRELIYGECDDEQGIREDAPGVGAEVLAGGSADGGAGEDGSGDIPF